ncbi:hypothetical protein GCM10010441_36120 [Kitasatospora paracochleata]|uniref:Uncharacterized protein n=1 Tax=Kitasatospora paracochleata TaxID=58354 RepID=A0ABT1J437_9ACTN|nr:hypothetical protein [Kitasatospora paracochleata]
MKPRVLSATPNAETVRSGLPDPAGRRERFRRYAREHFVDAEFGESGESGRSGRSGTEGRPGRRAAGTE